MYLIYLNILIIQLVHKYFIMPIMHTCTFSVLRYGGLINLVECWFVVSDQISRGCQDLASVNPNSHTYGHRHSPLHIYTRHFMQLQIHFFQLHITQTLTTSYIHTTLHVATHIHTYTHHFIYTHDTSCSYTYTHIHSPLHIYTQHFMQLHITHRHSPLHIYTQHFMQLQIHFMQLHIHTQ